MGKRIRVQRKGKSPNFNSHRSGRKGPARLPKLCAEAVLEGRVERFLHDRGRGTPLAVIRFPERPEVRVVAVEGLSAGSVVQFGTDAPLAIGNCLPVGALPEGTPVSSVELQPGDLGKLAKQSGNYATVVGQTPGFTQLKLPSGTKRTLAATCRAIVGIPAAGGRTEKPLVKAGVAYYKTKSKRKNWPVVRGVAMNRVDHPHGGGNHQHLPRSSCVSRLMPPGKKVGLISARRTGRSRGGKLIKGD